MRFFSLSAIAALAAAGCATAGEDDALSEEAVAELAKFERTGEVQACLSPGRIDSIKAIDERLFLVRVGANTYYLNEVKGRCNNADRSGYRLQYTLRGSQLCRNEIIDVIDNSTNMFAGGCALGSFERLTKKPAPEEGAAG